MSLQHALAIKRGLKVLKNDRNYQAKTECA